MSAKKITVKPPLGIIHHNHWIEERVRHVWAAICRYKAVEKEIPTEWIAEMQTHIAKLKTVISTDIWVSEGFIIVETEVFK